eukprot:671324-Rhodomonas_salina.1
MLLSQDPAWLHPMYVILAIGDFTGWEATLQSDDVDAFDAASLVVQLALKCGCWGLTPGAGVADPAFYAVSRPPQTFAPPPTCLFHIHDFLTAHCSVVVPPVQPGQAPAGTLVLPALGAIAAATEEQAVQLQCQVTAAYMQHWQPHIVVLQRPTCTASLANLLDAQKAVEYDVEDNISPLIGPGSVAELTQGTLVHAPTAWIASFDAGPNRHFPKPKFQGCSAEASARLCTMLLGTKPRPVSATCGVPATILPAKLPRPVFTGDDRHADINWDWPTLRGVAIVVDKSALHPFVGKGKSTQWGTYRPLKLQDRINCKNLTYTAFHREQNMQFVPLVGTTLGHLALSP